jgi:hypothetical protein
MAIRYTAASFLGLHTLHAQIEAEVAQVAKKFSSLDYSSLDSVQRRRPAIIAQSWH